MSQPKFFRIAVYGLVVQNDCLLVAKEVIQGREITKFPGGGLQIGEGIADTLKREFAEELHTDIVRASHLYTTDFFVLSAFHPDYQVIAIYYLVETTHPLPSVDFQMNDIAFLWIPVTQLYQNILTFETDKKALSEFLKIYKH